MKHPRTWYVIADGGRARIVHEGQKVKYEVERDQRSGKMSATNLQAV